MQHMLSTVKGAPARTLGSCTRTICDEAIAHVSGRQSSCKGRDYYNILHAVLANTSNHVVKDDFACCK